MTFTERWRAQLDGSLAEFAQLATQAQDIDFTHGLLATAVLWPIRAPVQDFDGDAIDAVRQIAGAQGTHVLRAMQSWGGDPLEAAKALAKSGAENVELGQALDALIGHFDAAASFASQLSRLYAAHLGGDVSNLVDQIQAALVNIGGITNIQSLSLQLTPPAPLPPQSQIPPPPEPTRPPELGEFVGRQSELAYFAERLAGDHLAVISGMAGVGKTAMAAELARQAAPPEHIFWHSLHEDEGVDSILWSLAGFLAWHGRDGLWHMLQTAQQTGVQPPPPTVLLDYLFQLLRGQGYVLCLDDLHFVDDGPLFQEFVERLCQALGEAEVSLIITSRRVPHLGLAVEVLPLAGLSAADTERLLAQHGLSLPVELAQEVYIRTEGNAQLLSLTANLLKRAGDPVRVMRRLAEADDIERYLAQEVDKGLSKEDREILIAVAILLGYPGTRGAIERVAKLSRIKPSLLGLSDQHLLAVYLDDPEEAYGEHAIVREFYYDVPGRGERQAMHRRAGEYYEREEPDQLKAALHYEQAGDYDKAAKLASADIWALVNQGQARPLERLLSRLSDQPLEPETLVTVHIACGQVHAFMGEGQRARQSFQLALSTLARLPGVPARSRDIARACLGMGESLYHESPSDALPWLERGLAELAEDDEPGGDHLEEAALHIRIGVVRYLMGDYIAALAALEQGLHLLPAGPSQLRAVALLNFGNTYNNLGDLPKAIEFKRRALEISQQLRDYSRMLGIYQSLAISSGFAGDWKHAAADFRRALDLAEQLGQQLEQAKIENALGWLYTNQGEDESALTLLTHSLELSRRLGLRQELPYVLNSLALLQIRTGNCPGAADSLKEAAELALELKIKYPLVETYYLWAEAQLGQGQPQIALADIEQALAQARELRLEREEGICLDIQARALLAAGQVEPALTAFKDSLALLDGRDPYEAARTRAAWGQALAFGPDADAGVRLLREARATFEQLGAVRDLAEVEELLEA
jgi:ATP/maltotriose-dependent transcriptional regulator MalT